MKKIGIFYGSSGGTCEGIALTIASKLALGRDDVHDVAKAKAEDATACDVLLLGSSTWGAGDLQDDWFDFLPQLKAGGLAGKVVALFGCGDSASFGDTFCDAIGTLHDELAQRATHSTVRQPSKMGNSSASPSTRSMNRS